MPLDPTTNLGKVRLRIGDFGDLPLLSDSIINSALTECSDNVPRAAALCAQYILALISSKTHRRMTAALEVWGAEHFDNYLKFLRATILNPHLMDMSYMPYGGGTSETHPLIAFMDNWNDSYNNTPGSLYAGTTTY